MSLAGAPKSQREALGLFGDRGPAQNPAELDEIAHWREHRPMLGRLCARGVVAAAVGLTSACGTAPAPPSAIAEGAGSSSSTDQDILPNLPTSGDTTTGDPVIDAGAEEEPDTLADPPDPPPVEAGPPAEMITYYACTESQLIGCDYIHVTARDFEADLCFQLTLESCDAGDRSLAVDTPLGWRLASGSVLDGADDCVPGEFYVRSAPATDASGSISWNVEARPPAELVIDVTLELAPQPDQPLPRQASLSTSELTEPLAECAE